MVKQAKAERTIADFGAQWERFPDNSGFYGSGELFADIVEPLLPAAEVQGLQVAEIGSGTGRIVEMLLGAGARHITAIEPSSAIAALRQRFADRTDRVACHQIAGDRIDQLRPFDLILSIGVLHHIPEPEPVVRAAFTALRPGGRLLIWLYGREGNGLYLAVFGPLRRLTTRLPDGVLDLLVRILDLPLVLYIALCRHLLLPLPLRDYILNVIGRMAPDKRRLIIFDQLNPAHAKYYTQAEARQLVTDAGFIDVQLHHRHRYSWTVIGTKPNG